MPELQFLHPSERVKASSSSGQDSGVALNDSGVALNAETGAKMLLPAASCCSSCGPSTPARATVRGEERARGIAGALELTRENREAVACGVLALCGWLAGVSGAAPFGQRAFYALAVAVGGWPLLRGALMSMRAFSPDMNVLMSVATLGACALGDWGEAATLVFLYAVSEAIERAGVNRSRRAITDLMTLAPDRVLVRRAASRSDVMQSEPQVATLESAVAAAMRTTSAASSVATPHMSTHAANAIDSAAVDAFGIASCGTASRTAKNASSSSEKSDIGYQSFAVSRDEIIEDEWTEIEASQVRVGDVFMVRAGERVALDGIVVAGRSQIDQSPVTGESLAVEKESGAEVFAGTLNGSGVLEARATRLASDGTTARIARLVLEAEAAQSPRQRTVEIFARRYTPLVLIAAFAVAVVPPLLGRMMWSASVPFALALLVAGCPCAFVISGPVASICALAASARRGVLIRGGAVLEALADVRAFAFDKTGTLSQGTPQITDFIVLNTGELSGNHSLNPDEIVENATREKAKSQATSTTNRGVEDVNGIDSNGSCVQENCFCARHRNRSPQELIAVAAALEAHSEHPVARAIVAYARSYRAPKVEAPPMSTHAAAHLANTRVENVRETSGQGVAGTVGGVAYEIGRVPPLAGANRDLTKIITQANEADAEVLKLHLRGRGVALLSDENGPLALFGFSDAPRPEAQAVLKALRARGIEKNIVLSGDNEASVRDLASGVEADEWRAALFPADKLAAIRDLSVRFGSVAMVGDGINDAPALAQAQVGIAMGARGSDAALATADVALMGDDLNALPLAIDRARQARRIIRQNLVIALGLKFVFVAGLFAGAWGDFALIGGVFADMGATLLVVANGLRLLRSSGCTLKRLPNVKARA